MVEITQKHDDLKLMAAFRDLHPDIEFGKDATVQVSGIDGKAVLSLTVSYPLTDDDMTTILDASRVGAKARSVVVF